MADDIKELKDLMKQLIELQNAKSSGETPATPGAKGKSAAESIDQKRAYIEELRKEAKLEEGILETEEKREKRLAARKKLIDEEYQLELLALKAIKETGVLTDREYEKELERVKLAKQKKEFEEKNRDINKETLGSLQASMISLIGMESTVSKMGEGYTFLNAASIVHYQLLGQTLGELQKINISLAKSGILAGDVFGADFGAGLFQANSSLGAFLGLTKDLDGSSRTFTEFGIGFKELSAATVDLRNSMQGFSDITNITTKNTLAANAAQMKNLGVEVTTTGKNWDFLTKSLKMTTIEAAQTTDMVAKAAMGAGIAPQKMLQEFASTMPQLAAQGKKAVDIFIDLEKQSKALGMEVGNLLGIVGGVMDTFEGAASAAGKFNAVMGGDYLNSMELLNASESERVEILKRSFDQTGKNFDSMNKYEKIAVANALGVKSVDDAQRLLGVSSEEMRKKQEQQAANQKQLNDLQASAVDIVSKLSSAFQVLFGIAAPILKVITMIADILLKLNDKAGGLPAIILSVILLSSGFNRLNAATATTPSFFTRAGTSMMDFFFKAETGIFTLQGLKMALGNLLNMSVRFGVLAALIYALEYLHYVFLEPNSPILYFALMQLPAIIIAIGEAADKGKYGLLALGFAMLQIGIGVHFAAKGLAEFVKAFSSLNGEQLLVVGVALAGFALAMVGIVAAMAALALSGVGLIGVALMLSFGAAILMVGLGVKFAAEGMANLIDNIKELTLEQGLQVAGSLYAISGGIQMLMYSLTGFGIFSITGGGLLGLGMLAASILSIGAALNSFPEKKSVSFEASMKSLKEALEVAKQTSKADLEPALEFVKTIKEYAVVKEKTSEDDPLVKLLTQIKELLAKTSTMPSGTGGPQTIAINLDGKNLGTYKSDNFLDKKGAGVLSTG